MPHIPGGINLILILAVVLLVFGPEKVPEVARGVGKAMSEFKNAMRDVSHHFDFSDAMSNQSLSNHPAPAKSYLTQDHGVSSDPYAVGPHSSPYLADSSYGYSESVAPGGNDSHAPAAPQGPEDSNQSLLVG